MLNKETITQFCKNKTMVNFIQNLELVTLVYCPITPNAHDKKHPPPRANWDRRYCMGAYRYNLVG